MHLRVNDLHLRDASRMPRETSSAGEADSPPGQVQAQQTCRQQRTSKDQSMEGDLLSSSFLWSLRPYGEKATPRGKRKSGRITAPSNRERAVAVAAPRAQVSGATPTGRPRAPARNSQANKASGRAATRRARSAARRAVAVASATGSCVCLQAMLRSWRVAVESNGRGSSADRRGERTEARGRACVVSDPAGSCSVPWSKKMR